MLSIYKRHNILSFEKTNKIISITFKELKMVIPDLKEMDIQGELQEVKIEEMITAYLKNPHHFIGQCMLIIAMIVVGDITEFYLMDGQHRAQMCSSLCTLGHNDEVLLSFIQVKSKAEFYTLFENLNKDSHKCRFPRLSIFEKENYEHLKRELRIRYGDFAPKYASEKNRLYSIAEFVNIIIKLDISLETLIIREAEYFDIVGYKELLSQNKKLFSITEKNSIKVKSCILIKRNNFIDWLTSHKAPEHIFNVRKSISSALKKAVWNKYYAGQDIGKCLHSSCPNILNLLVVNSWHCGHIISVHNGGKNDIDNLAPICPECNLSMSYKNWD